jgi:hypothetical protein
VATALGLGRAAMDIELTIYGGYDMGSTPNPKRIGGRAVISVAGESDSMPTRGRRWLKGRPETSVTQGTGPGCQ